LKAYDQLIRNILGTVQNEKKSLVGETARGIFSMNELATTSCVLKAKAFSRFCRQRARVTPPQHL